MDQLDPDLGRPLELRVLTGPNLYFARPAIKLTLDASGVLSAEPADVVAWQPHWRARRARHQVRQLTSLQDCAARGTGGRGATHRATELPSPLVENRSCQNR